MTSGLFDNGLNKVGVGERPFWRYHLELTDKLSRCGRWSDLHAARRQECGRGRLQRLVRQLSGSALQFPGSSAMPIENIRSKSGTLLGAAETAIPSMLLLEVLASAI